MAVDLERIAVSALDAFLRDPADANGKPSRREPQPRRRRRLGGAGSLALGVALGAGARAAYGRVRRLDPLRLAGAVERRLED